jgi:protein phosphatase
MTTPASPDQPHAVPAAPAPPFSSLVRIDVSALSHPGHRRENNEDHFLVTRLGRTLQTLISSLPAGDVPERTEEVNYVMVVADGMGGHAAGEVASRMAISALARLALDLPDWHFRVDPDRTSELAQRTRHIVEQIDAELVEEGRQNEALHGMGTTLTGARSFGRDLMIAHVGDSRAYLLRGTRLRRLTRDHTYTQLLIDTGQLRATDAATSRTRHILTNVLGGSDAHVKVEIDTLQLEEGDRLLLCSDGLTDLVDDDTIATALLTHPTSAAACAHLVQLALDHGGRDNVTVIVAGYHFAAAPA